MLTIKLDNKIRFSQGDLPPEVATAICEALTIPNIARDKAKDNNIWGWQQMEEFIDLWEIDHSAGELVIPRGFLDTVCAGLRDLDVAFSIQDETTYEPQFRVGSTFHLHPWQAKAVDVLHRSRDGIWKAPAGSGKTVGVLELARRLACPSLVIVNTKDILWQWQARIARFLGDHYPVGQIGDDVFIISPYMTIATVQTLHSKFDELVDRNFFREFGLVCLDECHHAQADTYRTILDKFTARWRIGVSATPEKTGDFRLAQSILGKIVITTRPAEVSTLIKPRVVRVPTRFKFDYRPAQGRRQSNYSELVTALVRDDDRNELIVQKILGENGTHSLVLSKRHEHLDTLSEMLRGAGYGGVILKLTGKESRDVRKEVVKVASEKPCVIFSTLADEALDIPRLDRLFLAFPQKNAGLVTQQVGRIERGAEGKKDAVIFDFADLNVGPCKAQWRTRRFGVYEPRGYRITLRPED